MDARNTRQHLRLVVLDTPDTLHLIVAGEVDIDTVEPLRLALAAATHRSSLPVSVDLSAITFADTAIVNTLLRARLDLAERLRVSATSRPVRRLLDLLGVDHAFALDTASARGRVDAWAT
ncbi:STAS domain-containing protein [Streptomyces sp. NPDC052225]|uniref:STAS domain-containing protein n=1 Tax=Streptomyces sp. NPDC052225 TaxID=3154949 RepID=UPI00343C47C2